MEQITQATKSDLISISTWLKNEMEKNGEGFFSNISLIQDSFKRGELFVLRDNEFPMGFITGPLNGPNILSVKAESRGQGVGAKLVDYTLTRAIEEGISAIRVECMPKDSAKFWAKMGFNIEKTDNQIYGYRILEIRHKLPHGESIKVQFSVFPEEKLYDAELEASITEELNGVRDRNGMIVLEKRFTFLKDRRLNRDLILSITCNSKEIFFDKAKREKARQLGVRTCPYAFFIDKISTESLC